MGLNPIRVFLFLLSSPSLWLIQGIHCILVGVGKAVLFRFRINVRSYAEVVHYFIVILWDSYLGQLFRLVSKCDLCHCNVSNSSMFQSYSKQSQILFHGAWESHWLKYMHARTNIWMNKKLCLCTFDIRIYRLENKKGCENYAKNNVLQYYRS